MCFNPTSENTREKIDACADTYSLKLDKDSAEAVRLKEISFKFLGKLMPEKLDERRMPKQMKEFKDPFQEQTESTNALVMENGPRHN